MKFDPWTILFQIVNFIVLLFILKRLLFKPVRDIMRKRRDMVEQTIRDADAAKEDAAKMKKKCQEEMNRLDALKTQMTEEMKREVEKEREGLLNEARQKADNLIEKEKAILGKEREKFDEELRATAVEAVSTLASAFLSDLSGRELHRSIFRKLIAESERISSHIKEAAMGDGEVTLELSTAYPLKDEEAGELRESIESRISRKVKLNMSVDSSLIAGAKLSAFDQVYDSSLKGQIEALRLRLKEKA